MHHYIKQAWAFLGFFLSHFSPPQPLLQARGTKRPSIVLLDSHHSGSATSSCWSDDFTTPNPFELVWAPVLDYSTSHPCYVQIAPLHWSPHQIGARTLHRNPHQIGARPLHRNFHQTGAVPSCCKAPIWLKGSPCCNRMPLNHGSKLMYCFIYLNIYSVVSASSI